MSNFVKGYTFRKILAFAKDRDALTLYVIIWRLFLSNVNFPLNITNSNCGEKDESINFR